MPSDDEWRATITFADINQARRFEAWWYAIGWSIFYNWHTKSDAEWEAFMAELMK